jgi:hypothetical protein
MPVHHTCAYCGVAFSRPKSARRPDRPAYCSGSCGRRARPPHQPKTVTCGTCGIDFPTLPSRLRGGRGKYCSQPCYFVAKKGTPLAPLSERFWAKVQKTATCWLWTGARTRSGYGKIGQMGGNPQDTHRVSWELHNGAIPDGLLVCHHCDVKLCIRPDHLFLGTHLDNARDYHAKRRAGLLPVQQGHDHVCGPPNTAAPSQ